MAMDKKSNPTKAIEILYNGILSGVLEKTGMQYIFTYHTNYIKEGNRSISITMPIQHLPYKSKLLFPVFANLLSEGVNKKMQCRLLKIDESDYFGLLIATAKEDSIGPITIKELKHDY